MILPTVKILLVLSSWLCLGQARANDPVPEVGVPESLQDTRVPKSENQGTNGPVKGPYWNVFIPASDGAGTKGRWTQIPYTKGPLINVPEKPVKCIFDFEKKDGRILVYVPGYRPNRQRKAWHYANERTNGRRRTQRQPGRWPVVDVRIDQDVSHKIIAKDAFNDEDSGQAQCGLDRIMGKLWKAEADARGRKWWDLRLVQFEGIVNAETQRAVREARKILANRKWWKALIGKNPRKVRPHETHPDVTITPTGTALERKAWDSFRTCLAFETAQSLAKWTNQEIERITIQSWGKAADDYPTSVTFELGLQGDAGTQPANAVNR